MTPKTDITGELTWAHATRDIPQSGLSREHAASPEELAGVARVLDLVACTRLEAAYAVVPASDGRYRLSGTLRAEITQTCVVTLEPVANAIEERFDVTFWPDEDMPAPPSGELDMDEEPDPEPIVAGQIAVGRVVFECLAAAIDPFPRKPGAVLDWRSPLAADDAAGKPENPFAVLATIKPKA